MKTQSCSEDRDLNQARSKPGTLGTFDVLVVTVSDNSCSVSNKQAPLTDNCNVNDSHITQAQYHNIYLVYLTI